MTEAGRGVWAEVVRREQELLIASPPPTRVEDRSTIHFSELAEDTSGGPLSAEWNRYRREAGRLLAEGHEDRWVLVADEDLVGIWDTELEARAVAVCRYAQRPVLIHRILTWEPLLRGPVSLHQCHNSTSLSRRAG
jgi:hypothetical protein